MTAVADVLAQYGIDNDDDDFARSLAASLAGIPGPNSAPLTPTAMSYLAEHGGEVAHRILAAFDPAAVHRAQVQTAVATETYLRAGSLTRAQIAAALQVTPTRISHLTAEGKVWVVRHGGRQVRYPAWQVHRGRLLPGLAAVVGAIPAGTHPLDVEGAMTTEQDETGGRTPVEHLADGGDPEPVAALIADLDRW